MHSIQFQIFMKIEQYFWCWNPSLPPPHSESLCFLQFAQLLVYLQYITWEDLILFYFLNEIQVIWAIVIKFIILIFFYSKIVIYLMCFHDISKCKKSTIMCDWKNGVHCISCRKQGNLFPYFRILTSVIHVVYNWNQALVKLEMFICMVRLNNIFHICCRFFVFV